MSSTSAFAATQRRLALLLLLSFLARYLFSFLFFSFQFFFFFFCVCVCVLLFRPPWTEQDLRIDGWMDGFPMKSSLLGIASTTRTVARLRRQRFVCGFFLLGVSGHRAERLWSLSIAHLRVSIFRRPQRRPTARERRNAPNSFRDSLASSATTTDHFFFFSDSTT